MSETSKTPPTSEISPKLAATEVPATKTPENSTSESQTQERRGVSGFFQKLFNRQPPPSESEKLNEIATNMPTDERPISSMGIFNAQPSGELHDTTVLSNNESVLPAAQPESSEPISPLPETIDLNPKITIPLPEENLTGDALAERQKEFTDQAKRGIAERQYMEEETSNNSEPRKEDYSTPEFNKAYAAYSERNKEITRGLEAGVAKKLEDMDMPAAAPVIEGAPNTPPQAQSAEAQPSTSKTNISTEIIRPIEEVIPPYRKEIEPEGKNSPTETSNETDHKEPEKTAPTATEATPETGQPPKISPEAGETIVKALQSTRNLLDLGKFPSPTHARRSFLNSVNQQGIRPGSFEYTEAARLYDEALLTPTRKTPEISEPNKTEVSKTAEPTEEKLEPSEKETEAEEVSLTKEETRKGMEIIWKSTHNAIKSNSVFNKDGSPTNIPTRNEFIINELKKEGFTDEKIEALLKFEEESRKAQREERDQKKSEKKNDSNTGTTDETTVKIEAEPIRQLSDVEKLLTDAQRLEYKKLNPEERTAFLEKQLAIMANSNEMQPIINGLTSEENKIYMQGTPEESYRLLREKWLKQHQEEEEALHKINVNPENEQEVTLEERIKQNGAETVINETLAKGDSQEIAALQRMALLSENSPLGEAIAVNPILGPEYAKQLTAKEDIRNKINEINKILDRDPAVRALFNAKATEGDFVAALETVKKELPKEKQETIQANQDETIQLGKEVQESKDLQDLLKKKGEELKSAKTPEEARKIAEDVLNNLGAEIDKVASTGNLKEWWKRRTPMEKVLLLGVVAALITPIIAPYLIAAGGLGMLGKK